MGGGLGRSQQHNDNSTGHNYVDNVTPTLTIAGELDGQYRVTRAAEGYYRQVYNIIPSQKDKFPVVFAKGISHGSYMDNTMLPSLVFHEDINPEIS